MAYEKRVCVMKQVKKGFSADGSTLSGAIYCERLGGRVKVTPRLLGLAPVGDGRYLLALNIAGENFFLDYAGGSVEEFEAPELGKGFSALLCFVRGERAEAVAFGFCGQARCTPEELVTALMQSGGAKRKRAQSTLPPEESAPAAAPKEKSGPFRAGLAAVYDDEAIATADYYKTHADENAASTDKKKGASDAGGSNFAEDEAVPPRRGGRTLAYYNTVREKLKEAFKKYPRDERFLNAFPYSEWVRAGEVLLGIIYEEGTPSLLCTAKSEPFPEEAGASFVPFNAYEEGGMFVVFQSADTGEYVKVHEV